MHKLLSKEPVVEAIMVNNGDNGTKADDSNVKYINSRFGEIRLDLTKSIFFPAGLLGMSERLNFCLANFPNPAYNNFKILQSLEDDNLSFIILPLGGVDTASSLIDEKDLMTTSELLNVARNDMIVLLITSVHNVLGSNPEIVDKVKISVNVRAPLIIDSANYTGTQFVFNNDKYLIQHVIN
jgi:flagellar assembly factor FliW